MAKSKLKTTPTSRSVAEFVDGIADEGQRADSRALLGLMQKITKAEPKMWGPSIVGFGSYHYRYESGREGDWFLTGFAPRKGTMTVYIMAGFDRYDALMQKLGRHKTGKSCLYIKRLADVDMDVLAELVRQSVEHMKKTSA